MTDLRPSRCGQGRPVGKRSRRPLSLQNGDFGFPVIGARLGPSRCGTRPAGGKTEPPAAVWFGQLVPGGSARGGARLVLERNVDKIFGQVLPEILFSYMSTIFCTGRGLDVDEIHF